MKNDNIRALVIDPVDGITEKEVPNALESFQELVGGNIEVVPYFDFLFIVDEDGKLKHKPANMTIHGGLDVLVGTVVAVGDSGDDFCSLTQSQIAKVKDYCATYRVNRSLRKESHYMPFLNIVTE